MLVNKQSELTEYKKISVMNKDGMRQVQLLEVHYEMTKGNKRHATVIQDGLMNKLYNTV